MNHCMTVWANRSQIFNWVNVVFGADLGYGNQMMNVNISSSDRSIDFLKHKAANTAHRPVVLYTSPSCGPVAFICVDLYSAYFAFLKLPIDFVRSYKIPGKETVVNRRPQDCYR